MPENGRLRSVGELGNLPYMSRIHAGFVGCLAALLVVCAAREAQAFSLFGNARSTAVRDMRKADEVMVRADAAFDGGNKDQALQLYRKAAETYGRVNQNFPDVEDGLARYRLAYCESQIQAITGREVTAASPPTATGDAAVNAGIGRDVAAPAPAAAVRLVDDPDVSMADAHENPHARSLAEAQTLLSTERLDAAAGLLIDVLKADPQNRDARLLVALVRCRQGRFDEARVALEDLQAEREDEPVLLALAAAYQGTGRYQHALLALDKTIRASPRQPAAYVNMAWLLLTMPSSDAAAAEANYRQALKLGARRDRQLERRLGFE